MWKSKPWLHHFTSPILTRWRYQLQHWAHRDTKLIEDVQQVFKLEQPCVQCCLTPVWWGINLVPTSWRASVGSALPRPYQLWTSTCGVAPGSPSPSLKKRFLRIFSFLWRCGLGLLLVKGLLSVSVATVYVSHQEITRYIWEHRVRSEGFQNTLRDGRQTVSAWWKGRVAIGQISRRSC